MYSQNGQIQSQTEHFCLLSNVSFSYAQMMIVRLSLLTMTNPYQMREVLLFVFSVLLVLRLPRLGKRELILVFFVRLFDLCLFGFVGFLFLGVWEGQRFVIVALPGLFSYLFSEMADETNLSSKLPVADRTREV